MPTKRHTTKGNHPPPRPAPQAPPLGVIVFPQEIIPTDTILKCLLRTPPSTVVLMVPTCLDYTEHMLPVGFKKGLALRNLGDSVLVQVVNEQPDGLRLSAEARTITTQEEFQEVWGNVIRLQRVQPELEFVERTDDQDIRPGDSVETDYLEPTVSNEDTGVEHQQPGEVLPSVGADSPSLLETPGLASDPLSDEGTV